MKDEKENKAAMNKMGTEPIKKLMLTMGIPMIISMALQAFYNIVDSYFVSCMKDTDTIKNMGDYAMNALTLAFPIQMLMVAISVGTGVGINAILSKSLGEGDNEKCSLIAGNAVFIGFIMFIVFFIFGLFGVTPYFLSQTRDQIVIDMGGTYLRICTLLSFGITFYITYEKLLQATGKTVLSTIAQIAGAVANIILDPILIFGFFGLPEMGIAGAAYATVIGQCVSCALDIFFHQKYNKEINASLKYVIPKKRIIGEIYRVGIPAIIMQALMSFMTYGVNIIFGAVSDSAVTAYGIYYKIQQFVFFAAFGMNNAIIPIVGFNYGKRDRKRIDDGIKYGMIYTLIIMFVGAVILEAFATPIMGVFNVTPETARLCVLAVRIICLGYLFVGANVAYQGIFQALSCGVRSLILSLLRLIVIALPLAWVLTKFSNASDIIWIAFPIAEFVALIAALFMMRQIKNSQLKDIV